MDRRAGSLLLSAALASGALAAQQPKSECAMRMGRLGKAIRAIDEAAAQQDPAAMRDPVRLLIEIAPTLASLDPQALGRAPAPAEQADAAWFAGLVQQHAQELLAAVDATDSASQQEANWRLRQACASCHLRFRPEQDPDRFWPGEGRAIAGRLRLRAQDGSPVAAADHVVVFVEGLPRIPAAPGGRATIRQRDRRFLPDLLAVPVGTTVSFPNLDPVFHNIFSLSKPQPFDLGLYGQGESREVTLTSPGLVKIYCNIHPEMVAHVLVLENPHAVRAAPSGFFCLTHLPDRELRLRTWSELGCETVLPVQWPATGVLQLDLELQERHARLPHRNKHGRPYREKY
jgi:plastocyanin